MIEEPEISLHIEAQLELPPISEHLILALKPLIVNGELKPEDVAIWHFEKKIKGKG